MPMPWAKPKAPVLPHPQKLGTEEALKRYYEAKVKPVEERHIFSQFYTPPMHPNEFDATGTVMLLGQYSVGKTTLVQYLMGQDYPGAKVGPEPTTDMFTVVKFGETEREMFGATIVSDDTFPFPTLDVFGQNFLSRLKVAQCNARLLKDVTFIDTPGILTGEKQETGRGYDFKKVVQFLAEKVDRIYILFDCSKLDIGDEYKTILQQSLGGNEEKIRIVLNKADAITSDELMRVRGALMWSLGKVLKCAEVPEVFIGSYWGEKVKNTQMKEAFAIDFGKLMTDLAELPSNCKLRKINDVAKRARMVRSHAMVMDAIIKRNMKLRKTQHAVASAVREKPMAAVYDDLIRRERLNRADMPEPSAFRAAALRTDPTKWNKTDANRMQWLKDFIEIDLAVIIRTLPPEMQNLVSVLEPNLKGSLSRPLGAPKKAAVAQRFADEDKTAPPSLPPMPPVPSQRNSLPPQPQSLPPVPPPSSQPKSSRCQFRKLRSEKRNGK